MEERKSHDNSEEESGSIPDEIELNQNNQDYHNQKYLAEMAIIAQMYGDPNNFMKVMYQGSEVVLNDQRVLERDSGQMVLFNHPPSDIDGSGGGTDSGPYWIPAIQ